MAEKKDSIMGDEKEMENNLTGLREEYFRPKLNGQSVVDDIETLQKKIDRLHKKVQQEQPKKLNYVSVRQAEKGKIYTIFISENGRDKFVKAEFLTKGRGMFFDLGFFRHTLKNGQSMVYGISEYNLVKESIFELSERERE